MDSVDQSSGVFEGVGHGHTVRLVGVAEAKARAVKSKVIVDMLMKRAIGKSHTRYFDPSSVEL